MFNFSKVVSLIVVITTSMFLYSCNNDEASPNEPICLLDSITVIGNEIGPKKLGFDYDNSNRISKVIINKDFFLNINHGSSFVTTSSNVESLYDTMFVINNKWTKSVQGFLAVGETGDPEDIFSFKTTTVPTYQDGSIVKLKQYILNERNYRGSITIEKDDSTTVFLNYNALGNVISIRTEGASGNDTYDFLYSDSTKHINVTNYYMFDFYNDFLSLEIGSPFPLYIEKFRLFKNPPSQVVKNGSTTNKIVFTEMKTNSNNYLTKVISKGYGSFPQQIQNYSFTLNCR